MNQLNVLWNISKQALKKLLEDANIESVLELYDFLQLIRTKNSSTNENQTLKECPNLENEIYDVRKELLILHKNQIYELYGERNNLKTFLRTTWGVRTNLMEFFRANEMTEENNAFMNYMLDFGK
uniref:Uncharacterized protein n=1 Tax=Meloidogyne hapla TaxID=6305 RepID=A0A1I8B8P6_MELHA